ncbi:MAG: GAF domain-containing protein [Cyanobacteriota bacterium]|nr:GAF domain-containing protein [Cyanobacteriota bacterium]
MSDRHQSQERLLAELKYLRSEVAYLRTIKLAFDAQNELVRSITSMGQAATGHLMLRAMVLQAAHIASKLTHAEECSLLLLRPDGGVEESILARGATIRENKKHIIDEVLADGLAGWVARTHQLALITDATQDERWITLPDQPYTARSVLCLPIMRGRIVVGVLTLTHSEPNKFSTHMARVMQMCATQMALALDNARLYIKEHQKQESLAASKAIITNNRESLSQLGLYIIDERGKFIYANHRLADIFGYPFPKLAAIESIAILIAPEDRHWITDKLQQCFASQIPYPRLNKRFRGQKRKGETIEVEMDGVRTKFYGKSTLIGVLRLCRAL